MTLSRNDNGDRQADPLLVAMAQCGDSEALRDLLLRNLPLLRVIARRHTDSAEDAEDVMQEAVLNAIIHVQQFRNDSRFSTWLCAIAINLALDLRRKRKRWCAVSIEEEFDGRERPQGLSIKDPRWDPEHQFLQNSRRHTLLNALRTLPHRYKSVLQYHELDEMTVDETARRAQISVRAARSRLVRGRKKLLQALNRQSLSCANVLLGEQLQRAKTA